MNIVKTVSALGKKSVFGLFGLLFIASVFSLFLIAEAANSQNVTVGVTLVPTPSAGSDTITLTNPEPFNISIEDLTISDSTSIFYGPSDETIPANGSIVIDATNRLNGAADDIAFSGANVTSNTVSYSGSPATDAAISGSFTITVMVGPVLNSDTGETFATIQAAIDDADTDDGDTIMVSAGTYTDPIVITKELGLEGGDVAIIQAPVRIQASNVTVNEFIFDGGADNPVLLRIPGTGNNISNVSVTNNVFENMNITSNNDSAALTIESSTGTLVDGNIFRNLTTKNSAFNRTIQGILIGDTGQSDALNDITISNNIFENIEGARGAYGMIVNRPTNGLVVNGNTISNIVGNADSTGSGWASGIGLDADTPNALVRNNVVSNVTSLVNNAAGAFGIIGQTPSVAETITVEYNDFLAIGGAENRTSGAVDLGRNWWGSNEGPKYIDLNDVSQNNLLPAGAAVVQSVAGGSIETEPWLCGSFTSTSDVSINGNCDFLKPVITVDSPADNFISGGGFDITVTVTDETELGTVVINLKDANGANLAPCLNRSLTGLLSTTTSCTVDADLLGNGNYEFRANVRDAAGNISRTVTQRFTIDDSKPVFSVITPVDNFETTEDFEISVSATDTVGLKQLVVNLKNEDGSNLAPCLNKQVGGVLTATGSCIVDVSLLGPGTYQFRANAHDVNGNVSNTVTQTFIITEPSTAASLLITAPAVAGEIVSGLYEFMAEYIDNDNTTDRIQWAIRAGTCDRGKNTIAGNVDGFSDPSTFVGTTFSALVSTTDWLSGEYCFVVNPQEGPGEEDLRATQRFMVDNIEYAPYCGDGVVNQDWEMCELGNENCTAMCTLANQCTDLQLLKVTFNENAPVSESFDGEIYLGAAGNIIPSGIWFNFNELGDAGYVATANSEGVRGLVVERDVASGLLTLAFRGDNGRGKLDFVQGTIESKNIDFGTINRSPNPSFKLENGSGGSFADVFDVVADTTINFDLRADTGHDGVSVEVTKPEDAICPVPTGSLSITAPAQNNTTLAGVYTFVADYQDADADPDEVFWAIRAGTCSGTDVAGNAPASPQPFAPSTYDPTTGLFEVTLDMTSWANGEYCFVVNPREDAPAPNLRETRRFTLENTIVVEPENPDQNPSNNPDSNPDQNSEPTLPSPEARETTGGTTGTKIQSLSSVGLQPGVLGIATSRCELIKEYLRMGVDNNPWEVWKLQAFLIGQGYEYVSLTRNFDEATDRAVRAFQETHRAAVLTPWVTAGLAPTDNPTGWVYLLTKWKINDIVCGTNTPMPELE